MLHFVQFHGLQYSYNFYVLCLTQFLFFMILTPSGLIDFDLDNVTEIYNPDMSSNSCTFLLSSEKIPMGHFRLMDVVWLYVCVSNYHDV